MRDLQPRHLELQLEQANGLDESTLLCIRHGASRQLITVASALQKPVELPRGHGDADNVRIDLLSRSGSAWLVPRAGQDKYNVPLAVNEFGNLRSLDIVVRASGGNLEAGSSSSAASDDSSRRISKAMAAKDYLQQHDLQAFMKAMTHAILREKPQDPFAFMATQLPDTAPAFQELQESNAMLREQLFASETESKRLEREMKELRAELAALKLQGS
jgi:hypothetical protein